MKELFVAFYKKSICSLITVMDGIGPYSPLKIKTCLKSAAESF